MNAHRKKKLQHIVFILFGLSLVLALIMYALRQNISLFYAPSQVVHHKAPANQTIRLGGMVEKRSVIRSPNSLAIQFNITDFENSIVVHYVGILPDLFREGQGVVVEGMIDDNSHMQAKTVLAKHDENYMPKEVKEALAKKVRT